MDIRFKGKTALITGTAGGIGFATGQTIAMDGGYTIL